MIRGSFSTLLQWRQHPSLVASYASLLHQCALTRSALELQRVHTHMLKFGLPHLALGDKLVDAYVKCGAVDDARKVFDEMLSPHIVSWNNMISSYVRSGRSREAVGMYDRMRVECARVDEYTYSSVLRVFADEGLVFEGRRAHGQLVLSGLGAVNVFLGSALVHMYAKFGMLNEARLVFNQVMDRDVVLFTTLIVGCIRNGNDQEAIRVYDAMIRDGVHGNEFTFASILVACGNLNLLAKGQWIHGSMIKLGCEPKAAVLTSLLVMYAKCSLVDDSLKIFSQIKNPNVVTWTAVIGVLVSNHKEEKALSVFRDTLRASVLPNEYTLSTALRACSGLAVVTSGKQIHAQSIKMGMDRQRFVVATLVDMYGKCGNTKMARSVLDNLPNLDVVSVNSMIYGYAQNGDGQEAVELFDLMVLSGLEPNDISLTSVLSGCSNSGLLEEGKRIFSSIPKYCDAGPSLDHYACMVDLLGHVGRLAEAESLIKTQVRNPDVILWRALLNACRIHGDLARAETAANKVLELDPSDDGTHVLLSNIYASLGKWQDVIRMKTKMREMQIKKDPAMTWIEVNREVHTFLAGDRSHPMAEEIYAELTRLIGKTKGVGYVPDTRFVLQELDEIGKETSLYYHSEKLAIAFAVLAGGRGCEDARIVIFKNLRVCGDCHSWLKFVTKVIRREITARDAKRFHHFKDGICSCGDFW